jgi:ABC-type multidrug transport system ATPase subunit
MEAKELLKKLKLDEKKDALAVSLSGGQKRKISLGCALITGAKGKLIQTV